jgi:hypothetical protein
LCQLRLTAGSSLSPMCFDVYTEDMIEELKSEADMVPMHADDLVLVARSRTQLVRSILKFN